MAYKNHVEAWREVTMTEADHAAIKAIVERVFKAAGGKGELPKATSMRNALKGVISFDESAFKAGNVVADDADATLAKQWAEAIAAGRGSLDDLADWPMLHKMAKALLARKAPPAPPVAKAPPAPPAKLGAEHGVTVTRRKRAA
jgi:hypothetical protein